MLSHKDKLFRLLNTPVPPCGEHYIPDCVNPEGVLDPRHDNSGRELVNCFLVDADGCIAMFLNRQETGYVPYNTLFHIEEYNRFLLRLFPDCFEADTSAELPPDIDTRLIKIARVHDYLEGRLSLRCLAPFELAARIYRRLRAYHTILFDKEFRQASFRNWKELKRYFQGKGLYAYTPSADHQQLIRIFSPNRRCDSTLARQAKVIGQQLDIRFCNSRSIPFAYLMRRWQQG